MKRVVPDEGKVSGRQAKAHRQLPMKLFSFTFAALLPLLAASAQSGFPFTDETLRYNLNWQGGTSLGEAIGAEGSHLRYRYLCRQGLFATLHQSSQSGFTAVENALLPRTP